MDDAVSERRRDARFGQPAIARFRGMLRPATTVALVDLSAGGALVQAGRVLRPGARVHVQIVVNGRSLITAARVLRCSVASLDAEHGVRYEGALKFEPRCDTLWESRALAGYEVPAASELSAAAGGHGLPDAHARKGERSREELK